MNTQEKTLRQLVQCLADIDLLYHQILVTTDDETRVNIYKQARDSKRLHILELNRLFEQYKTEKIATANGANQGQCSEQELLLSIVNIEWEIAQFYQEILKKAELNAFQLHVLSSQAKSDLITLKQLVKLHDS